MFARYKFVQRLIEKTGGPRPVLNKAALIFGVFSCVGMCFVATFQVCPLTLTLLSKIPCFLKVM